MTTCNFEMGTGKTCTAVGVAEGFINNTKMNNQKFPSTILKKIIVLTKGKGLQSNFINEIANVCTKGQYLVGLDKYMRNRDKRIRKNVKVDYTFDTFEIFSKALKKMSDSEKMTMYENSLFIVDEAHNLRMSSDPEENNIYTEIYGLFKLLKNRKILLLTGTPMKDQPEEIINLMNLFLRHDLTLDDLNDKKLFKEKITGYVSYLRTMMSDINREEVGYLMGTLNHFKVYPVFMDDFQAKVYLMAKQKDDDERSIFNHSRQASLMVFPDGTYGKNGFEQNIIQKYGNYQFSSPEIRTELLTQLHKYSAKYDDLLKKLKSDYADGRLSFIFSEFVKGSGLIVLSLLLELHGYVRATAESNFSKPQKRYAIFTNETSTDSQTRKLTSVFNNPKNMKGEYISTIIGSRVIMEGFSFKNIQSEYILTPHWNYSETSQIIARGLRLGSHNDLLKSGITPEVKIYHYVAFPYQQSNNDSIDLHMYEIAEKKDFAIQQVMRTLKEAAFDCQLTKDRNTITNSNLNNTRNCEYQMCEYKCDNPNTIMVPSEPKNYQLLYFRLSEDYLKLKQFMVQNIINHPISVEEIMAKTKYTKFEILTVLQDMLNYQEVLYTRPEGSYYLTNFKNLYYASIPYIGVCNKNNNNDGLDDPNLLNFYTKKVSVFMGKSIDELIFNHQKNFMVNLINQIFKSQSLIELQKNIVLLPIYLQDKLLCYSISLKNKNIPNSFVRDMVLNNFKLYYSISGNNAFVWLDPDYYKCTVNVDDYRSWKSCSLTEQKQIEKMKKARTEVKITNNPYGYIGLLNRTSNDFCLKKIQTEEQEEDKRKRNVGKRCQNWRKKELVDLVSNRLKINPDEDFNFNQTDMDMIKNNPKFSDLLSTTDGTLKDYKRVAFWNTQDVNYLCSKILQNFMEQKMVIDDPNCGTSKKIR